MIGVKLKDSDSGDMARVTPRGQVVVSPLEYSQFYFGATASNDVPVNIVTPLTKKNFVIDAIVLSADRSIAANGVIIDIYENSIGPTDTTITKQILQQEMIKQSVLAIPDLNILITAGRWINIKSDDVIVRCNISGYFVTTDIV